MQPSDATDDITNRKCWAGLLQYTCPKCRIQVKGQTMVSLFKESLTEIISEKCLFILKGNFQFINDSIVFAIKKTKNICWM